MASEGTERATIGWAARDPTAFLSPYTYTLRNTGREDVYLRVLYCGLCHTDIHQAKNDLGLSHYPMVPGHEIIGEVLEVGSDVSKFRPGDRVGVSLIVGCCRKCDSCKLNIEQYCTKRIWTFNDVYTDGKPTQGGFSTAMVVDQKFVVKIPEGLAAEQAAPLLCAGLTVYSPLRQYKVKGQSEIKGAILGLGGVGHMGVKIAKAMGHNVTVISSSEKKRGEAMDHLGADVYLASTDANQMTPFVNSFDYILDTLPVVHPLDPYLSLLKVDGRLIIMGAIGEPLHFLSPTLLLGRKSIIGAFIGSMEEASEMLEFCTQKGISSQIEVVKMDYINKAMERLEKNDVRYRFVVDVAGSKIGE